MRHAGHILHPTPAGGWGSMGLMGRRLTSYRECTRDAGMALVCGWKVAVRFASPWCSVTHSQGVRHAMGVPLLRAFPAVMLPLAHLAPPLPQSGSSTC